MSKVKNKILIVHRYFYPDTPPYAMMLYKIAKDLSQSGISVDILTSMPTYYGSENIKAKKREMLGDLSIRRLNLLPEKNRNILARSANSVLFAIFTYFIIIFRSKYNLIMVGSTPPIIMSTIIRWVSKLKRSKYIYHSQDIYPEIAYGNGNIKSQFLYRQLLNLDRKNNLQAEKTVILSQDMLNTLVQNRNIPKEKIAIINNFIRTERESGSFDYSEYGAINRDDFTIVFCGNLGKLQNLHSVIEAAHLTKFNSTVKYIFIGDGIERQSLEIQAGDLLNKSVYFLGYMEPTKAHLALREASIGLVSISDQTYKTAYPCKTMTYLNAGLPILALLNSKSELSNFIVSNRIGLVANPDDPEEIKNSILAAVNGGDYIRDPQKIMNIADQYFSEESILRLWLDLYQSILDE